MEVIKHRCEKLFGVFNKPVTQCSSADINTHLLPILLLTVQRNALAKLLISCPRDSRSRGHSVKHANLPVAALDQLRNNSVSGTVPAAVCNAVPLDDLDPCRNDVVFGTKILLPNASIGRAAFRAHLLVFRKINVLFFIRTSFQNLC